MTSLHIYVIYYFLLPLTIPWVTTGRSNLMKSMSWPKFLKVIEFYLCIANFNSSLWQQRFQYHGSNKHYLLIFNCPSLMPLTFGQQIASTNVFLDFLCWFFSTVRQQNDLVIIYYFLLWCCIYNLCCFVAWNRYLATTWSFFNGLCKP